MALRVYSAIVTGDPGKAPCEALDGLDNARARVDLLEKLVKDADNAIDTHAKLAPAKDPVQRVFLAPEYFFSRRRFQNDRFFGQDFKRWIVGKLAGISKNHPSMLIVPGTVLWTKTAVRDVFGGGKMSIKERLGVEKKNTARLNTLTSKTENASTKGYLATDETAVRSNSAIGIAELKTTGKFEIDSEKAKGQGLKIAQNTAYVLLNGKILKYHKMGNYRELEKESDAIVFQAGNVDGRFSVGGVRYGLEICLDHNIGMLQKDVDIQLIVSSYVNFDSANDMSEHLVLHSSTEEAGTYSDGKGGTIDVKTDRALFGKTVTKVDEIKAGDVTITCWDIKKVVASMALDLKGDSIGEVSHIHDPDTLGL